MAAEHFHNLDGMGAPDVNTPEYAEWAAQDLRPTILAVLWVFLALCALFVGLRLYVRLRVYRRLLEDDWWLTGGMASGLMSAIIATVAVGYGNGRHMPVLSEDDREGVILWTTVAFCPGILFFGLPKLAVLTLLCRLLDPQRWLRRFFWTVVIISQLSFMCLIGLVIGRCRPFKKLYRLDMEGECLDIEVVADFGVYVGALSALVDVILAVYPAIVLFQMPMSLRRRIGLASSLGIGSVGGAIAIYKTLIISDGLSHPDFSYHSAAIIIWTTVEGSTVIMAASIPVFAPLLDMAFKGRNPFRRSSTHDKPYKHLKHSHEMSSRSYSAGGSTELGRSTFSESQVDMLTIARDAAGTPMPGPGQIICTNEINITYEKRPLMDPLEAMLRGYDTTTWRGW